MTQPPLDQETFHFRFRRVTSSQKKIKSFKIKRNSQLWNINFVIVLHGGDWPQDLTVTYARKPRYRYTTCGIESRA